MLENVVDTLGMQFPINLLTIFSIFLFTFLFDLIDLKPQVSSFRFLRSGTYFAYFSIRIVFGLLAAIIIQQTGLFPDSIILAFVSVMTSITTLQNFTLKLGGQNLADLPSLFENYRLSMIDDELELESNKTTTELMNLSNELAKALTKDDLKRHATFCLKMVPSDEQANNENSLEKIVEFKNTDEELYKLLLASEIVNINPDYAKKLLQVKVPKKA